MTQKQIDQMNKKAEKRHQEDRAMLKRMVEALESIAESQKVQERFVRNSEELLKVTNDVLKNKITKLGSSNSN